MKMNQALTENQSIKYFDDYSQGDDKESDEMLHIDGKSEDSLELTNTAKKIQVGKMTSMPLTDREHMLNK